MRIEPRAALMDIYLRLLGYTYGHRLGTYYYKMQTHTLQCKQVL